MQVQSEHHARNREVLSPLDLEVGGDAAASRIPPEVRAVSHKTLPFKVVHSTPARPPVSGHAKRPAKKALEQETIMQYAHLGIHAFVLDTDHACLNIRVRMDGSPKTTMINVQCPLRTPTQLGPK